MPAWALTRNAKLRACIRELALEGQREELISSERGHYAQLVRLLTALFEELVPHACAVGGTAVETPPVRNGVPSSPKRPPSAAVTCSQLEAKRLAKAASGGCVRTAATVAEVMARSYDAPPADAVGEPYTRPLRIGRVPSAMPPLLPPGFVSPYEAELRFQHGLPPEPPTRASQRPSLQSLPSKPRLDLTHAPKCPPPEGLPPRPPNRAASGADRAASGRVALRRRTQPAMVPTPRSQDPFALDVLPLPRRSTTPPLLLPPPPPAVAAPRVAHSSLAADAVAPLSEASQAALTRLPTSSEELDATTPPADGVAPLSEASQAALTRLPTSSEELDATTPPPSPPAADADGAGATMALPRHHCPKAKAIFRAHTTRSKMARSKMTGSGGGDEESAPPPPLLNRTSSDASSDALGSTSVGNGPRFIPGRHGVTKGYLLPLARELQFNFEEPPADGDTAECDRYHALMLLACWEEIVDAEQQAAFWSARREGEKTQASRWDVAGHASTRRLKAGTRLRGAVRAQCVAHRLQAPNEAHDIDCVSAVASSSA